MNCSKKQKTVQKLFASIKPLLEEICEYYECKETYSKEDAKFFINNNIEKFDVFVACGGDGSLQLIASELIEKNKIIGLLPLGTGNDFSKIFGLNLSISDYLSIIKNQKIKKYDLIKVNNESYCINTFGMGFDGLANEITTKIELPIGKLKYFVASLKALNKLEERTFEIQIDDTRTEIFSSYMVVICNGKWEGGSFFISPQSDPSDGKLEMLISLSKNKRALTKQLFNLYINKTLDSKEFKSISFQNASIKVDSLIISHSDGEVLQPESLFKFSVIKNAITILSP